MCGLPFLFIFCAKKKELAFIVIGSDSLKIEQLVKLDPAASSDSVRIRNLKLRMAVASVFIADSGTDILSQKFSEQLQLRAGEEWNPQAAGLLLSSAKVLYQKLSLGLSPGAVVAYAESLFTAYNKEDCSGILQASRSVDSIDPDNQQKVAGFFSSIFGISESASQLLFDFLKEQDGLMNNSDAEKMVKGLVFSETEKTPVKAASVPIVEKKIVDNSVEALKYRGQQSIMDSIARHIPNLKSIYKKRLKVKESMSGTVMVSFRVSPSGTVVDAKVSKTGINDEEFLSQLLRYVKDIQFKKIPEKIGNMSFEFPFEFNPE